jgi:hypothetical protein
VYLKLEKLDNSVSQYPPHIHQSGQTKKRMGGVVQLYKLGATHSHLKVEGFGEGKVAVKKREK